MFKMVLKATLLVIVSMSLGKLQADQRVLVDMPEMMQKHMLANMRDHLAALQEITQAIASSEFDRAAEIAEQRLGMSSMQSHGASHMAPLMPQEMRALGQAMHRSASAFASTVRDNEFNGTEPALNSLSQLMQQCVACHSAYRIR